MLVLLIEDDVDARDAVTDALHQEGCTVTAHASGEAALRWLERGGVPDAILSDHWMRGGMNGMEFHSQQLRLERASTVPFVLMTADDIVTASREADKITVVRKPFNLDQLRAALRVVMEPPGQGASLPH